MFCVHTSDWGHQRLQLSIYLNNYFLVTRLNSYYLFAYFYILRFIIIPYLLLSPSILSLIIKRYIHVIWYNVLNIKITPSKHVLIPHNGRWLHQEARQLKEEVLLLLLLQNFFLVIRYPILRHVFIDMYSSAILAVYNTSN